MSLLFIIFGRKVRDKDYGPSYPMHCPGCDNDVYYHAFKWRSWFHIFWIPLIPWFSHGELVCSICGTGFELDPGELKQAKELVDETQRYRELELSDREYAKAVHEFETTASFVEVPTEVDQFPDEFADTEIGGGDIDQTPSG